MAVSLESADIVVLVGNWMCI